MQNDLTFVAIRLDRFANSGRIFNSWWDIINLTVIVLALVLGFLALSSSLLGLNFGLSNLLSDLSDAKKTEVGINVLALTISGGSAAALWIVNKGTLRWATLRRVYFLNRYTLKCIFLSAQKANGHYDLFEILQNYRVSALSHFENISVCHPLCQKYYEEILFETATLEKYQNCVAKDRSEIVFRLFMISIMAVGRIRGMNLNLGDLRNTVETAAIRHRIVCVFENKRF